MKKILSIVCLCAAGQVGAQEIEEIIVRAHPLSDQGLSQATTVLRGDELAEELQNSLGETVANAPGMRSASFGGAVGRPIIHGLGGGRVKTTEDRIDTLDASVTSGDHAVTVEPFIANQITVLKGASTLLYGSGAIGGVVDTETGRIPTELPEEPISGRAELRVSDNANGETGAMRLDGKLSESVAWHVDAFSKQADDYEIPGAAESRLMRESEGESEDEDEATGTLAGSRFDVTGGAVGASWFGDAGFIGVSVSKLNADYGLVGGHGHEHEDEHEHDEHEEEHSDHDELADDDAVGRIDLEQTRTDLEAQLNNPFSGIESINFRLGINDYQHQEIEPSGEVGTFFENQAWEARVEARHTEVLGFSGAVGLQLSDRDFSALGEEAFVPPVQTQSEGIFWVGERDYSAFSLEAGARVEQVEHNPTAGLPDRDYQTVSASLGFVVPQNQALSWSGLLDYTERAPSIEELYANGPHLATQTFEIGSTELQSESGTGLTFSVNYESDLFDARASVYHTQFDRFIYQANTGLIEDELPVFVYRQQDAEFTGLDLEMGLHLVQVAGGDLDLTAMFDTVDAKLTNGESGLLPRIPSNRTGLGLAWHNETVRAKLDYTHVSAQRDVAALELPTESYSDITAKLSYRIVLDLAEVTLFVNGRNLGDEEQRHHTSFVKDLAPAPGRRIEAGIRVQF